MPVSLPVLITAAFPNARSVDSNSQTVTTTLPGTGGWNGVADKESYNQAEVTTIGDSAAAVAGENYGTIEKCYNVDSFMRTVMNKPLRGITGLTGVQH